MENIPPMRSDQFSVMELVGTTIPVILREAMDDGFFRYCRSRDLDADGYADYAEARRNGMLNDRILATARELVDIAAAECKGLRWQMNKNKCATEIMLDPFIAFRIKRAKRNRGGLTTGVRTNRQLIIKSPDVTMPIGQMAFPGMVAQGEVPDEYRIWLTGAFDLDELEERITRVGLGVEIGKRFLWRLPLQPVEADVIARLSTTLADRISDMRKRRMA